MEKNDKNSKIQCSGKLIHVLRFAVEQPPELNIQVNEIVIKMLFSLVCYSGRFVVVVGIFFF